MPTAPESDQTIVPHKWIILAAGVSGFVSALFAVLWIEARLDLQLGPYGVLAISVLVGGVVAASVTRKKRDQSGKKETSQPK